MKLILTQEVTGLGAAGDVVEVKDGYGRNYLIPRGFGIRWTRGGEKTIESIKKARDARSVRDADHAAEVKAKLEGSTFNVKVRAGEGGRLFGAVTAADIADAITEAGAEVDKRTIVVGNPIKSLGAHTVTVKVHDEVEATGQPQRRLCLIATAHDHDCEGRPPQLEGGRPSRFARAGASPGVDLQRPGPPSHSRRCTRNRK